MVAKGSPDWLPSGWTVEYKVQKTGRKVRFYTNLESGKSFVCKDDVIGYIKSTECQKALPTSRRIKPQSGNSPVQLTMKTNEHPEWLPAGWKVESRTRMSGSHVGNVYKCYIDPATGNRFYSKPEVFRYLRTVRNKLCTLKERKTSNNTNSRDQVVIEKYKDDDLPPGWIKEIKIRERADVIRKDAFYIDPKSGYVFRSKKDALHYLETGEISKHAFKPKEGGNTDLELVNDKITRPSTGKGQDQENSAETHNPLAGDVAGKEMSNGRSLDSPVGTIPKIVSTKKAVRKSREIDQKNSQRELPEAVCFKSNKTEKVSPDNGTVSKSASEMHGEKTLPKAENPGSNKIEIVSPDANNPHPLSTTASKSQDVVMIYETREKSDIPESKTNLRKFRKKKGINLPRKKTLPETENPESNKVEIESPDGNPLSNTASKSQDEVMIYEMTEKGDIGATETKLRKSRKKKGINLPQRSSKRLAGLEPELKPNAIGENPPQVSNQSFTEVKTDVKTYTEKACQQLDARPERDNSDIRFCGDRPSKKRKTPSECSLDAPEVHLQRERTKKLDGDLEAQLCVPIPEFLSDPCLEFAIKTLTGALPVENVSITNPSVSTPIEVVQGKGLMENGSGSKKEPTLNHQCPINRLHPERASFVMSGRQTNLTSNEAVLNMYSTESGKPLCNTTWETGVVKGHMHCPSSDVNTEQCNDTGKCEIVQEDQLKKLQIKEHATSETPLTFPFGDSWSDPCLDFAFKTLTGAIPIEDSLGIQSYFEERLESSRSRKESSLLPDFGSPNSFQNDVSTHFEGPEKSVSEQNLSLDSYPATGNLPSCSGFSSQQPCFKGR